MAAETQIAKKLNEEDLLVICAIEQVFYETQHLPTDEAIADKTRLPVARVKEAWKNPSVRQALAIRGVDLNRDTSIDVLTPRQLILANMLLNVLDKRSIREKLAEAQVSTQQYNAWKNQPAFTEYLRKRAEREFASADSTAYSSLVQAVEGKDVQALKLFFEMRGIYNPRLQVDVNIQGIIMQIVDIVSKHVKDPVVLNSIAVDISALEVGG